MRNKMLKTLLLIVTISLGFIIASCNKQVDAKDAYVTVSINPSVEIITGESGKVVQINALNDDAQVLLLDYDYEGKRIEVVIDDILKLAVDLGFLKEGPQAKVIISVEKDNKRAKEALTKAIERRVERFREARNLSFELIKGYRKGVDEKLDQMKEKAQEKGLEMSRYNLAIRAMYYNPNLTLTEAKELSVSELKDMVCEGRKQELEYRGEYLKALYGRVRSSMEQGMNLAKIRTVEKLGGAALMLEKGFFDAYLEDATEDITPERLVALYSEFAQKIFSVNVPMPDGINIDLEIEALIKADEEINAWKEELNTLKQEFIEYLELYKEKQEDDLFEKLDVIHERIMELRKLIIEKARKIAISINVGVTIHIQGDFIIIIPTRPWEGLYKEIREEYVKIFMSYGLSIEAYERLFFPEFQSALDAFKDAFNQELIKLKPIIEAARKDYDLDIEITHEFLRIKLQRNSEGKK